MDTYLLYLTIFENNLYACIRQTIKQDSISLRSGDFIDDFYSIQQQIDFFIFAALKKHDKSEPGVFKEEFCCTEMIVLCSKTYCCWNSQSNKFRFSSRSLKKRTLEECGDGLLAKYHKLLEEVLKKLQQIRVSAQYIILLPHMSNQRRGCHTFILREKSGKWNTLSLPQHIEKTFQLRLQYLWILEIKCIVNTMTITSVFLKFISTFLHSNTIHNSNNRFIISTRVWYLATDVKKYTLKSCN